MINLDKNLCRCTFFCKIFDMISKDIKELIYLGPEGTYSQLAAEKFVLECGVDFIDFKHLNSIKSIINYVDENNNAIAVVPIENSIEGVVRETIDNLTFVKDKSLKIIAEFVLPINNCLLSKNKICLADIDTIISYTQPLAQCREFIVNNLSKDINIRETMSTAQAAKALLSAPENWAAIANRKAAEVYELNIIAENINDTQNNKTRFVVLARTQTIPSGKDKTSIVFSTKNTAGALCEVLNIFKDANINLSYIDSRPSAKNLKEYNFYLDFDGHIEDEKVAIVLSQLKQYITFFRHNGSYKRATD